MITTEIEINASPETVRRVLLDFPNISKWHTGFVKSITPLDTNDPLSVSKKLHCVMKDFEFESIITASPPVMTVAGLHSFLIEPSKSNPGGTIFTQTEEYSGGISFLMQPWLLGKPIKGQFEEFNTDMKKKCESH
ncbi:hypothetical protein BOTNAR_0134g00120 [Botryotinia narcissicola]|uniref:SRPBCC family protein n=1 Tax=Botryotinia narcissicola TaxID=278944 RepID=A0A4Z1IKR4_9HELO|nr:hypothetical protein BOTNAR_0134g00120 [Botryotinia narcissicola]